MEIRLNKFIAQSGFASRRDADELIKSGRVSVNGKVIKELGTIVDSLDKVYVDGTLVSINENKVYYMLYKPTGYISMTRDDRGRKTVMDLVKDIPESIYPIGRLDYDTSGLLLFTNDGDFSNMILKPSHEIEKEYEVRVKGLLRRSESEELSKGGINMGEFISKPLKIFNVEYSKEKTSTTLNIIITEGKNREIRRLFDHVDHQVVSIKRVRIGNVSLDVRVGEYRRLKPFEVKLLKLLSINGKKEEKTKKPKILSGKERAALEAKKDKN